MPQTAPSILADDFTRLGKRVLACAEAGVELIHVEVMDGRFVPNISTGLAVETLFDGNFRENIAALRESYAFAR